MNSTVKTSTTPSMVEMKVRILVVDDDKICLAVTASVLKLFNYEVVTINCPLEALSSLRMNPDSFDIVLSDVHMPLMNGLNFQRIVELEFHIPVILMSADDKKNLLMRSLENGAAFFIVKPPSISDLKNIWQYVIARRKNNATIANATIANAIVVKDDVETCNNNNNNNNNNAMAMFNNNNNQSDDVFAQAASYGNNNNNNVLETSSSDNQRQLSMIDKEDNNIEGKSTSSSGSKKPKLIWTTALHNKFLEAISVIGTSRAVPKKILEYMNVPGLTRENIASHLQKYRIYVRRLNEANGGLQHGFPINWNERPFRSSFSWSQFPTLANNSYLLKYSNTINHQPQTRAPTIPNNYGPHHHQGLPLFNNTPQNTPFVPSSMINNHLGPDFVDDHKLNFNIDITTRSTNIIDSSTVDSANNTNASIFDMARHNGLANGDDGPMLGLFRHNNADNQFNNSNNNSNNNNKNNSNNSSNNNNNAFLERLSNTAPTNNQVDNNMSNMNNSASIGVGQQGTASNPSNAIVPSSNVDNKVPIGRVGSANNNANASTLQSQADEDTKDILTLSSTSARTSVPHNDWAPNHMDDFNLEYGMEDINAIFSNIDAQNGNNN